MIKNAFDIDDPKKQQVRVLIGNFDDTLNELFSELVERANKNKYDLKFFVSDYGPDILELAQKESIDLFILVINNIFHEDLNEIDDRLENSLQMITQIKEIYGKPVIALSGWEKDASVIERAKQSADFYFSIPCNTANLIEAIGKCFAMPPLALIN